MAKCQLGNEGYPYEQLPTAITYENLVLKLVRVSIESSVLLLIINTTN
jgi:hypothetical protein